MKAKIFIISAPSGAGKSTLVDALLAKLRPHHPIQRAITYTSRQPRINEKNGYDFHFLTEHAFESLIAQDYFLEWSNAYGTYYGTPRSVYNDVQRGLSHILVIDRVGAQQIKAQVPDAVLVWITVSHIQVLRERLTARGTENEGQIERRLARAEIEMALEFQEPLYKYQILNEDFAAALSTLSEIFYRELEIVPTIKHISIEHAATLE